MNPMLTGNAPPKSKISGYKQQQIQQFTPQQMNLLNTLMEKLMGGIGGSADYLSRLAGGDESLFEDLEKPAYSAFEKLLGQTASRFSDVGARDSSYFDNAVAGQGAELAQNLQAQRLGLRNDAINSLLGQSQSLLNQRPFESIFQAKRKKEGTDWGSIGQLGGSALGGSLGFLLGGPAGAMGGAQLGGSLGRSGGSAFTR